MKGDFPVTQQALDIFDCFRGQITEWFLDVLKKKQYATIPPYCTEKLQIMDLSVNKCAKDYLNKEFHEWYASEVATCLTEDLIALTLI